MANVVVDPIAQMQAEGAVREAVLEGLLQHETGNAQPHLARADDPLSAILRSLKRFDGVETPYACTENLGCLGGPGAPPRALALALHHHLTAKVVAPPSRDGVDGGGGGLASSIGNGNGIGNESSSSGSSSSGDISGMISLFDALAEASPFCAACERELLRLQGVFAAAHAALLADLAGLGAELPPPPLDAGAGAAAAAAAQHFVNGAAHSAQEHLLLLAECSRQRARADAAAGALIALDDAVRTAVARLARLAAAYDAALCARAAGPLPRSSSLAAAPAAPLPAVPVVSHSAAAAAARAPDGAGGKYVAAGEPPDVYHASLRALLTRRGAVSPEPALWALSVVHARIRRREADAAAALSHSGGGGGGAAAAADASSSSSGAAEWSAPDKFARRTAKFWVHPRAALRVKAALCRILPLLVYGGKDPSAAGDVGSVAAIVEGARAASTLVSSVYLDAPGLDVYRERLSRADGARLVRLRYYGARRPTDAAQPVFVERKTHREPWTGEPSVKERAEIRQGAAAAFLAGGAAPPAAAGPKAARLLGEVQEQVVASRLGPSLRTEYARSAWQAYDSARVRVSYDDALLLLRERGRHVAPGDWCAALEAPGAPPLPPGDAVRFPYGVLEVKLAYETAGRDSGGARRQQPAWLDDLLGSGLLVPVPGFSKFLHGSALLFPAEAGAGGAGCPRWFLPAPGGSGRLTPATLAEVRAGAVPGFGDAPLPFAAPRGREVGGAAVAAAAQDASAAAMPPPPWLLSLPPANDGTSSRAGRIGAVKGGLFARLTAAATAAAAVPGRARRCDGAGSSKRPGAVAVVAAAIAPQPNPAAAATVEHTAITITNGAAAPAPVLIASGIVIAPGGGGNGVRGSSGAASNASSGATSGGGGSGGGSVVAVVGRTSHALSASDGGDAAPRGVEQPPDKDAISAKAALGAAAGSGTTFGVLSPAAISSGARGGRGRRFAARLAGSARRSAAAALLLVLARRGRGPRVPAAAGAGRPESSENDHLYGFAGTAPRAPHLVRARIEPKTFFANERTFLQWINIGALVMMTGLGLLTGSSVMVPSPGAAAAPPTATDGGGGEFAAAAAAAAPVPATCWADAACRTARVSGAVIAPASVVVMVYALVMFRRRSAQILRRDAARYDDQKGPAALALLLVAAATVAIALTAAAIVGRPR